ncbi:hypothetical protein [Staphylococcus sp. LCT-H4]|uniref:hypothetical protein n=1 Tax=Staphylococcus sp. LCT-H4 TaxID=1914308 RepID=UPI0008F50725|nr:hypothetical protein [Staphylococcus sp. LCT-H4]OIJ29029.1 hypothetical protein BK821_12305 [Staphylococcus sp. LCT-H4]
MVKFDEGYEDVPTQEITTTDKQTIKEELKDYADKRQNSSIIGDTHTRSTYLISDDTLDKLEDLVAHIEATNGLNSELTKGMSKEEINKGRVLSKGVKSKIVNFAIQSFLNNYEAQEGLIPDTEHKRYNVGTVKSKIYHNAYRFTNDGVTYGITQDNRGKEISFMSTDSGNTVEEINEWFDSIKDETKKQGAPKIK